MAGYPFKELEAKWQDYWDRNKTFRTPERPDTTRPKFYVLDMFPYPSGRGLHVGHPEGYTASDIVARYKRMRGFNVLHPIGWDAFGLPTEQYAIETGIHPSLATARNVARYRDQLKALGFSYDWDREVNTTDPDYYRWTQWIFKQLFDRGLAYRDEQPVWWCTELGTTLANEEVIDGKSERGGYACVRRPLRQWVLRITEYADELLAGLDELDWPDSTKEMQRNWIGRSDGAEISFAVAGRPGVEIRVFTTRPDTLFGATYMVLAPEHELVDELTTQDNRDTLSRYRQQAASRSDLERAQLQKEKTGVSTGAFAINPANGKPIPIWVADYVLASYGTGAIMAVPGQDERDWEFASQFGLPIVRTVQPPPDFEGNAYLGDGIAINSGFLDSLHVEEAKITMIDWLEAEGKGRRHTNYKLRDWLFSRQRYWGEPFPIVFVDGEPEVLPDDALPLTLPELEGYKPSGSIEGPLAAAADWLDTESLADGRPARRETNVMPQWAGSCWYYLRYIDPDNGARLVDPELERYWMPVDLYIGGQEHAVLHLLYARFWHKVLYDAGVVSTPEPFAKLVHQGTILGEPEYTKYVDTAGEAVSADQVRGGRDTRSGAALTGTLVAENDVVKAGERFVLAADRSIALDTRAHKMSKSRGNVVNPDEIVGRFGADAFRLYEMFMGPLEQAQPWSTRGVEGTYRFLNRVWRLIVDSRGDGLNAAIADVESLPAQSRLLHRTIAKVTDDIEALRLNTAIAALMEFTNAANKWQTLPVAIAEHLVLLLAPLAPHIAEELWHRLGHGETLAYERWPEVDPSLLVKATLTIAVQVNGKMRGNIEIPADAEKDRVLELAREAQNVSRFLEGKALKRAIYVPRRIVNFVVAS